jgi:surface antigen
MVDVANVKVAGNNILATFTDGSTQLFARTAGEVFIPTPKGTTQQNGSGGEVTPPPPTGGTPGTVAAPTDDYPWPNAPQDSMSPLRYSYRDCTDFVAWRCNRDVGCTSAPWKYTWGNLRWQGAGGNGDAIGWRDDWVKYGRGVDLPAAAGLIGWYGTKAGTYGHVCYIQAVAADGTITIEEYNWSPYHQAYNKDLRTQKPGDSLYPDSFLATPYSSTSF